MNLLIDSHMLIWLLYEPGKVTQRIRDELDGAGSVAVSPVSLWELTLKYSKGKLAYPPAELVAGVAALRLSQLPIRDSHLVLLPEIQLPHPDPFDNLLIAQSEADNCSLVTADRLLLASRYRTVDAR